MKDYKKILADIRKNAAAIKAIEEKIVSLDNIEARRDAAREHNFDRVKELRAEAEKNAEKVKELSDRAYMLKIAGAILKENAKAAFTAEALAIIAEVCTPYNGKSYGEKTRDKIYSEAHARGVGFYFTGYGSTDRVAIYPLDPDNKYKVFEMDCDAYTNYNNPFITAENKINLDAIKTARSNYVYIEKPTAQARAIIKAYEDLKKATDKAEAAQSAFNAIIPEGIGSASHIGHLYATMSIKS